jgi:hypothetical protein
MPHDGGYLDQPAGMIRMLRMLANVHNSYHSMVNTKLDMKTWTDSNPQMWQIVGTVESLRKQHGRR